MGILVEATVLFFVVALLIIISLFGPGGYLVVLTALKAASSYVWKALLPLWVVLKQKGPYKAAAVGLVFINFWVQFYGFIQAKNAGALDSALNALAATLVGGFSQVVNSGYLILMNPTNILLVLKAVLLMVLGLSSILIWFMGWRLAKNKVPELTYYILVIFLGVALAWGVGELNAIFEAFDLVRMAAENETINKTVENPQLIEELPFN